ncbi:putative nuclease HARBI1 [Heterodontus francisci]|uniref:putative nuclease HARBI1 n=1 Tax=Heterodontus francisci TaxID=7792 RepID=UPI00355B8253
MSREAVPHLRALFNDDMQPMDLGGHSMPVALKVTAALNFYASASFQRPTRDLCGVTQSAMLRCIRDVTNALYWRASDYVRFTTDTEGHRFWLHCRIPTGARGHKLHPYGHLGSCWATSCILKVEVLPLAQCSCHDAFIMQQSQLLLLFTEMAQMEEWLLGDKGYPLQTWLLIPVRYPTTAAEERYNACHGATRATIKQVIGMLKMHFCCLGRLGGALQYEPERVARIVAVCCALHNYALNRKETLHDEERRQQDSSSDDED